MSDHDGQLAIYESLGLRVLPLSNARTPVLRGWTEGVPPRDEWPNYSNVGLVTGLDGMFVIDIDNKNGKSGSDTWWGLQGDRDFPNTWTATTPNGGFHIWLRVPEGEAMLRNEASGSLGEGIDIRGYHGYVVAPPSEGYRWIYPPSGLDMLPAVCPDWLWEALHKDTTKPTDFDTFASQASYIKPARQESVGNRPGDAFNAVATCDELLVRAGWTFHHSDSSGNHYTRPGKNPRDGISATVWHDNGRCTNWSTNSGLEVNGWLTPYSLLAQLEFNGDYRATTRALGQEGWGTASSSSPTAAATVPQEGTTEAWAGDPPGDDWAGWEPYDWTMLNSTDNPRPTILGAEVPGEEMKEDEL